MYWSRTGDLLDILRLLLLIGMWWLAGWLFATYLFRVRARERLVLGLAIGLLLCIVLTNLAAQVLGFVPGVWVSAGVSLLAAGVAFWRSRMRRAGLAHRGAWVQVVALVLLTLFFVMINRGLGIFDDNFNLPLVSVIAAGDVPPHFFFNPQLILSYHYGLHLLAAILVRVGGMFPWSAFDLSKAVVMALMIVLTYEWVNRVSRSRAAGLAGAAVILLVGGTRWLLLLLPGPWLGALSAQVHLMGSALDAGQTLRDALLNPWRMDGQGPIGFPFAFVSSLFQPSVLSLGGSGVLASVPLLFLLLTQRKVRTVGSLVLSALMLGSLGLIAEIDYVMLCVGGAIAFALWAWGRRSRDWKREFVYWFGMAAGSLLLVGMQGGVLTNLLRGLISRPAISSPTNAGFAGFYLHWPPALVSSHLGALSLLSSGQALLALFEIGPILLAAPIILAWAWRHNAKGRVLLGGIGIGSILGFLLPLFLWYGHMRDSSRGLGEALSWWLVLAVPALWPLWEQGGVWARTAIAACVSAAMLPSIVILGIEIIAIARPQLTYFVGSQDARMSKEYWDRLEPDAQVFDRLPYRSVTLFGRGLLAAADMVGPYLPTLVSLQNDPDPSRLLAAGYQYIYLDDAWWGGLSSSQRLALARPCVRRIGSAEDGEGHFRWLLSIAGCGGLSSGDPRNLARGLPPSLGGP